MVEKKIKFITSGQLMSFCDTCQKMKSDIDVTDMANRNFRIDGKSILGLMSIKLGLPMRLIVDGEDEELANEYFTKYEFEYRDTRRKKGAATVQNGENAPFLYVLRRKNATTAAKNSPAGNAIHTPTGPKKCESM